MSSGKLRAKATLNPPLSPPQVIIKAVFFSNFLNKDKKAIGILTPIPLDITTRTITSSEIAINGIWKDSKITIISKYCVNNENNILKKL